MKASIICAVLVLMAATFVPLAHSQAVTGTITGRALDASGALIPGVDVSITSPAMIGGARSAPTDEQGTYRFTLLPAGTYRVTFQLPGFKTLNIEGVDVTAGMNRTINGTMEVASVAEEVTVTSQAPTIDLEAATVGINWDQQKFDNLPYGRGIRGLAQMIPGLYNQNYDVGGNTLGGSTTTGSRDYGRSGGESISFDGVVWDQFFGDFGTYDEVQISAAAKGAEAQNPGASISFVIKSGGNDFHGSLYGAWQDGKFQSNNVNQKLIDSGFIVGNNKFTHYDDWNAEVGGRILRDKFWFYTAFSHNYSGQFIPGFISEKTGQQAEFFTQLDNPTLKLTYQLNDTMKLDLVEQLNRKWQPYRTGSAFTTLEASQNQLAWTAIGPSLKWTDIISPKMSLDLAVNRGGYWWPDKAWTTDVRRTDRTTGTNRGAYNQVYRRPIRWQWNGNWSYFTEVGGKSNELKSGFIGWWDKGYVETLGYPNQQVYRYRSKTGDTDLFMRPDSVLVYDYPNFVSDGEYYNAWYVNDKITFSRKLTVNVGIRYDRYSSWLPEQGNPGTGPFATKNLFPENRDFPVYNSVVPRFSLAYDVRGDGRLALKASYGRYAGGGSGTTSTPAPRAGSVNPAATTTKTYNNWDGSIPYVPVPADLASVSGGGGTRRLDTNLKLPYLEEYTAGVELGLTRDYLVRFNVVRKYDHGGSKTLDLSQPYEAYTDFRQAVDPGPDNITGTADDGVIYAWSVPRSYPTFGVVNQLYTNVADAEGKDQYTAFETTFNKQLSNGWSMLGGYTVDFAHRNNNYPLNPNDAFYNWSVPEWNYSVKISGTRTLPFGMMWGATYQAQSGAWFNRVAQMKNALNSTVNVVADPHAGRYDWVKLWDNRISKTIRMGDRNSIEATFDLFNTLNASTVLSHVNTNGPNYLKPLASGGISASSASSIVAPRIFRLGARWRF
jgi:Carboxypeptidase regulatory-like domain